MSSYPLPLPFTQHLATVFGEEGRRWLAALLELLPALAEAWDVELGPPFPNLSYNYVAPATGPRGEPYVLKVGVGSPEGDREATSLRAYAGRGAVGLVRHDSLRRAMLLERVEPGDDLREALDPKAVGIVAAVLRELWTAPVPEGLPDLGVWTSSLERFATEPGPLPPDLLDRAAGMRRDLLRDPPERVVVHGDLHHANVLRSEARGWLAIDPKGVVGEKAYDVTQFLYNPGPVPPEATRLRIDAFVDRLGLDRDRVIAWAFVQSVVSACWTVEDHGTWWEEAIRFAGEVIGSLGRAHPNSPMT